MAFSSIFNPSLHGMLLDTLEDFDLVATYGGGAVLYPVQYADHTNLPENLHAAVAATSLRLRSLDYAKSKYVQSAPRRPRTSSHDLYMAAYRVAKEYMSSCAEAMRSNADAGLRLGTVAASVALERLSTSMLGAHVLYRVGLNYEGDAVARHILEQIAWAVAASEIDDNAGLERLKSSGSIKQLKDRLAPNAGSFYGRLSKTTHASLTEHQALVRSEGEAISVLLTWGRPAWSALTLLQLADLWVLAYEWTQRDHMTRFVALDLSAGYRPRADREFLDLARDLVAQIEAVEESERHAVDEQDEQREEGGDRMPDRPSGEAGASSGDSTGDVDWDILFASRGRQNGTLVSAAAAEDIGWWTDRRIARDIERFNVPTSAKRTVLGLEPEADLRSVVIPGVDPYRATSKAMLAALMAAPGYRFLEPWMRGIAMGPLADLQVYSSNARSRWAGKAHAPGHCQHSAGPEENDDLLRLCDWIALCTERRTSSPFDELMCSKCGGFTIRLLNEEQADYFHRARILSDAFEELEYYERGRGLSWADDDQRRVAAGRALDVASAIAEACPGLKGDCIALAERVMRMAERSVDWGCRGGQRAHQPLGFLSSQAVLDDS